eukprot:TRINITY_DN9107_c0_g1_i1.p1 TRINITY_DN9107_c0_g1~~TRINITY_DN9107_c0_g1_i1.p1  ORF type:complete len:173 (-),score=33.17 TRINITY_DN9107_c0_g1_i1:61-579(-)
MKDFVLVIDSLSWRSIEHYYQAQKFLGPDHTAKAEEYAEKIRLSVTANIARILANQKTGGGYAWRTKLNSDIEQSIKDGVKLREDWDTARDDVMRIALRHKFEQNPSLKAQLLSTEDAKIVEKNPRDGYWGYGKDGKGKNRLGEMLMELRDDFVSASKKKPSKEKSKVQKSK